MVYQGSRHLSVSMGDYSRTCKPRLVQHVYWSSNDRLR